MLRLTTFLYFPLGGGSADLKGAFSPRSFRDARHLISVALVLQLFITFCSVVAVVMDLDVFSRLVAGILTKLVVIGENHARRKVVAPAAKVSFRYHIDILP